MHAAAADRGLFTYSVKIVCGKQTGGDCCCVAGTRPGLYATEVNIQNFNLVQAQVLKFVQPLIHGAVLAREPDVTNPAALPKRQVETIILPPLAATMVLSTESDLATTDAALCGAVTLAMAALGKIYLAAREGPPAGRWTRLLLWVGLAASILLKGPIGPMVVGLTALDTLYVDFALPEQYLSKLAKGLEVTVRSDAFPGREFKGKLTAINSMVDPVTRNVSLQATLENPDHALHPGCSQRWKSPCPKQKRQS